MGQAFDAVRITDRVFWVGAVDWGLREFHGYRTSRGTTYNAFLIVDDGNDPNAEVTLIDAVKPPFYGEMMSRIASVVDPKRIRHVVSNHAELDHSGCLPKVMREVQPDDLIASKMGKKALDRHFHWDQPIRVVEDGETLELGKTKLQFIEARMIHWPDSLFTYLHGDGVLFPNDGFGMHLASAERFADEIDPCVLNYELAKYFANILLPFVPRVKALLEKMPSLGLELKVIAPDHGPVWRQGTGEVVERYVHWTKRRPLKKAVVVYDTMWQSTSQMAHAVAEGLITRGVRTKIMPLAATHRSDVATELLDAGALVVGSPTMNNNLYPTVADVLTYLKGLKPAPLTGAAFGSHGWSGQAARQIEEILREMKVDIAGDTVAVQYAPDADELSRCRALGEAVADRLEEMLK